MGDTEQQGAPSGGGSEGGPRSVPMAALAGAVVLIGLVTFALYRRHATPPSVGQAPSASAPAADSTDATGGGNAPGGIITASPPIRLTPEASILAERYRCVCGCNDPLSICTCRNTAGSEEMKAFLQAQVGERKSAEAVDQSMVERFGPASLLRNPAPPQTLPSHVGAPPPAGAKKRSSR